MALHDIVEQTVRGLGYDLVEVTRSAGGLLRITIDLPWVKPVEDAPASAEQFVTVEDCEKVNRQLQFALKNKMKVGLRVSYPDGSEKEHLIEPLGVAGGRVRGRDALKQAEVTLPLSRVIAIWLA